MSIINPVVGRILYKGKKWKDDIEQDNTIIKNLKDYCSIILQKPKKVEQILDTSYLVWISLCSYIDW